MDPGGLPDHDERLRAAVHHVVGRIAEEQLAKTNGWTASPHFAAGLAEIVFAHLQTAGADLEAFARHAKRATVTVDDVRLLARRNERLSALLTAEAQRLGSGATSRRRA